MPRKNGSIEKRDVLPDPVYNSKLVTRLINKIMKDGKKGLAQRILYESFEKVEKKTGKPAMDVFGLALGNIMPEIELKARRVGAANYQVPSKSLLIVRLLLDSVGSSTMLASVMRRPW